MIAAQSGMLSAEVVKAVTAYIVSRNRQRPLDLVLWSPVSYIFFFGGPLLSAVVRDQMIANGVPEDYRYVNASPSPTTSIR